MGVRRFDVVCEIEPATRPDLRRVRHQIGVLTAISSTFLIPDNHLGRATVSSVAVAHEVNAMGGRSIACLNARDRNLLGFRRDLLTAAAYGVEEFLFVYGDRPTSGARTGELTVRRMIEEARSFGESSGSPFRVGAACRLEPIAPFKADADFLFVQIGFSLDRLLQWRDTVQFDGPIYPGVIVLPSATMARKLASDVAEIDIPADLVERVDRDRNAGVDYACELVESIRASGAFDGVHLIPVSRYREVAARLERGAVP